MTMTGRRHTALLLLTFLLITASCREDVCDGDARTVNCQSPATMQSVIVALKKEIYDLKASQNSTCTVCWSDPCLNGGSCTSLSTTQYRCDCLDDYTGSNCQTHLQCQPNTCGQHTNCFVSSHKINCVCDPGYSGNPYSGCTLKTIRTCIGGDPHYTTFDGQYYDYMGTCPYTYVKFCDDKPLGCYDYFEVKARNQLTSSTSDVSYVRDLEVTMNGQKIYVDRSLNMYFNGVKQSVPYYYPNRANASVSVTYSNYIVTIANTQHFTVTFSIHIYSMCVEVPDDGPLQGLHALCGLGGNNDKICTNDFVDRDGTPHPVTSCRNGYQKFTEDFGDTWMTDDFLTFIPGVTVCATGAEINNGSLNCDVIAAKQACLPILNAKNGQGPFAACQLLRDEMIDNAYDECTYDACHGSPVCNLFSAFTVLCQDQLPNPQLDNWRQQAGCPALHCPAHSTYKSCATGCPQTCDSPNYNQNCTHGCTEGCECDGGYVADNADATTLKCVELPECGCTDDQGNYHAADERWLSDDCTTLSYCLNGTLHKEIKPCAADATCQLNSTRQHQCNCNKGYDGDGYMCTDTDECADPKVCNAGFLQGVCTNLPGSYRCECHPYYDDGNNCDSFLPLRHCADLQLYHNKTTDGVYDIKPAYSVAGKPAFTNTSVYCDMTTEDGGWTLMSGSAKDSMANKTYSQYIDGFGDPAKQDLWLGLEFIHQMAKQMSTSMRLNIVRCPGRRSTIHAKTYCTYPNVKVLDATSGYAVVLADPCDGDEVTGGSLKNWDGWFVWNEDDAVPKSAEFAAFDNDQNDCSKQHLNTGWWYDAPHENCGLADLNGIRYECDNKPDPSAGYLKWDNNLIEELTLYLRPTAYPDYDVELSAKPHIRQ